MNSALTLSIALGFGVTVFCFALTKAAWLAPFRPEQANAPIFDWMMALPRRWASNERFARFRDQLDRDLIHSGQFGQAQPGLVYLATGFAFMLLALLVSGVSFWLFGLNWIISGVISTLFAGGFGYWHLKIAPGQLKIVWKKQLVRQFPYFLDLTVMNMEAGANFAEAMSEYVRIGRGALSAEMKRVLEENALAQGTIAALESLRSRMEAEEIRNSLGSIIISMNTGTSVIDSLKLQAESMRYLRSQLAMQQAEELKVSLTLPGVVMVAAIVLLLIGGAVISSYSGTEGGM